MMNVQDIRQTEKAGGQKAAGQKQNKKAEGFMEILNRSLKSEHLEKSEAESMEDKAIQPEDKDLKAMPENTKPGNAEKTDTADADSAQMDSQIEDITSQEEKDTKEEQPVQIMQEAAAAVLAAGIEVPMEMIRTLQAQTAQKADQGTQAVTDELMNTTAVTDTAPAAQNTVPEMSVKPAEGNKAEASGKDTAGSEQAGRFPGMEVIKPAAPEQTTKSDHEGEQQSELLKDQSEVLKQMAAKPAANSLKTPTAQTGRQIGVEELQKQVDEQTYMDTGAIAIGNISGSYEAPKTDNVKAAAQPVMDQMQAGLAKGITKGLDTFTIRLKPDGLGEILVHLESAGGRTLMSIGVTNAETQKILNAEMAELKEMLKPLNAEVKEIYQNQSDSFDMMMYQQNLFQQRQQQLYARMHTVYTGSGEQTKGITAAEPEQAGKETVYVTGGLNAYV